MCSAILAGYEADVLADDDGGEGEGDDNFGPAGILSWLAVDVVIPETMGITRISSLGIQKLEAHSVDKNNYFI